MAASEPERDYFHIVSEELKRMYPSITCCAYNFAVWEMMSADRAETISLLAPYLNEKINVITIQLGENVNDLSTFENDYTELLKHIRRQCPEAKIIVVTDFWEKNERDIMKIRAAEKCGAFIADISSIKDNENYMCNLGTQVTGSDGQTHIVEHSGVSRHPGDKGMTYIAEKIIEQLQNI